MLAGRAYVSCGECGSVLVGGQRSSGVHTSAHVCRERGKCQHRIARWAPWFWRDMQEGVFLTVYTTLFGSAKS